MNNNNNNNNGMNNNGMNNNGMNNNGMNNNGMGQAYIPMNLRSLPFLHNTQINDMHRLPSRDISMNQSNYNYTNDDEIVANYIPKSSYFLPT